MKHCWRWFGPDDPVRLSDITQAGATGIVTALHHLPPGARWSDDEIARRLAEIAKAPVPLSWDVVESLPVSEDIKRQTGPWRRHVDAWKDSLAALARAGIRTICYNFMPVLDWTRTDLAWRLPSGGTAMRFDLVDFAAFDICLLGRPGAEDDYDGACVEAARARHAGMDSEAQAALAQNVAAGLPGAAEERTLADVRGHLDAYANISEADLRRHLAEFLSAVAPVAGELGLRICAHPDDPPWPLLGLPRILSSEADYARLLDAADTPANGITLCSGSLGANEGVDLPGMMDRLGARVHFLHLRNVRREAAGRPVSFHEAAHLDGSTDMVALVRAVLAEERRRRETGRDDAQIPMRPDHGQALLTDLERDMKPGYPAVGRLRGLAELRGVETALATVPA